MISWQAAHKLALELPLAEEKDHFGSPSFRVKGKIFAQLSAQTEQSPKALVKLSPADQAALIMTTPEVFSAVPQWGHHCWTYIQLATVEEGMLRGVLFQSWRLAAPKKLVSEVEAGKR